MIAGGAEELCPTEAMAFDTLYATSRRNDQPHTTPRPYDRDRDGLVVGEGAGIMILEELEHAQRRGARIHAELVGFAPDPDDPVPGHEVSLATISPMLYRAVEHDIGARVWPRLQQCWPLIEYRGLRDAFVIRYQPGEQESLHLHQDIAQVSATVRLNDGYAGAELTFPRQGYDNRDQPVVVWIAQPVSIKTE